MSFEQIIPGFSRTDQSDIASMNYNKVLPLLFNKPSSTHFITSLIKTINSYTNNAEPCLVYIQ